MWNYKNCIAGILPAILLLFVACTPGPDISDMAHPVHVDSFMQGKLSKQIMDSRRDKDDFFRSSPDSPLPAALKPVFTGLEYYPLDWKYRFEGRVMQYPNPPRIKMIDTAGEIREAMRYGYIIFDQGDRRFKLQVYRLLDQEQKNLLFIPFADNQAGKETYPAGRYLDLEEKANGVYVIDFNRAYNPSCAYGGNFACPVTPAENHLAISVPAGEKVLSIARALEKRS